MAKNLLKAGHDVCVWNRTAAAAAPVVEAGGTLAASAADAAREADVVFVMVSTPDAALDVAKAAARRTRPGEGLRRRVHGRRRDVRHDRVHRSRRRGGVSGGARERVEETRRGWRAHLPVRGDESLYAKVKSPLETMGKAHFFLGDVGQGAKMKLVVNMIMGSMMGAFAEGLTLAEKSDSILKRRCWKWSPWAPSRRRCSR